MTPTGGAGRLAATSPYYSVDPAQECANRCTAEYPTSTAFYIYLSTSCGCSRTTSGTCPEAAASYHFTFTMALAPSALPVPTSSINYVRQKTNAHCTNYFYPGSSGIRLATSDSLWSNDPAMECAR